MTIHDHPGSYMTVSSWHVTGRALPWDLLVRDIAVHARRTCDCVVKGDR